ncbi:MAG: anti-sigma factor family protein, partial [Thermomicrobiales bacterium]
MINHAEAQSLISARMDEPLDPIVARELDAHLATCPQCRAFASQTAAISQGLHDLPHLPASPRVRRVVLDTVQKPQTPWTRFQGFFAPGPGSAWSTVAAVLVVGILSVFVLTRLLGSQGGDDNDQQTTLLAPSVQTTRESDVAQANPTATSAPDEPTVPDVTAIPTEPATT